MWYDLVADPKIWTLIAIVHRNPEFNKKKYSQNSTKISNFLVFKAKEGMHIQIPVSFIVK